MPRLLALVLALAACSPPPPPPKAAPKPVALPVPHAAPRPGSTGEERVALFNEIVSVVREGHVFSDSTWENLSPLTFDAALPELRDAFAQATTERDLVDALVRLGNTLHDPHLRFVGDQAADRSGAPLTLPIVIYRSGRVIACRWWSWSRRRPASTRAT